MTVLEKKAASGVDGSRLAQYVGVAIVAGAVGIAASLGITNLVATDSLSVAEIHQIRSEQFAEMAQNQWIAQVNATKGADLVEAYRGAFMARVAAIQSQRAQDLVEHHADSYRAQLALVNEQRAQDRVDFRYGLSGTAR